MKNIVLVLGNWVVCWHPKFREAPKDLGLVSKHSFRWNDKGGKPRWWKPKWLLFIHWWDIHITKELMYENLNDFYSSIGGMYTLLGINVWKPKWLLFIHWWNIHITKELMYENLNGFYSSIGGIYTLLGINVWKPKWLLFIHRWNVHITRN